MSKLLCITAFLCGALAIVWMGSTFVATDALALAIIVVIGCVYGLGFIELVYFRRATTTLTKALKTIGESNNEPMVNLERWLQSLHPSLHNAVRLRIEGERVGLPAPIITPYLIGLLVMLGLLGTFAGMVDTLQGAVFALEGTTELQAIRAGLAAPISGLSLAFGTSVAGIAASAILGLISTVCRRDRMLATRQLDTQIATNLRSFSLSYQQQESIKAVQDQTRTLPEVSEKIGALAEQLTATSDSLATQLLAHQQRLHASTADTFSQLATSVERSLCENLANSARQTGEIMKPLIIDTMDQIKQANSSLHQQLALTSQQQLDSLSTCLSDTSQDVAQAWRTGIGEHQKASAALVTSTQDSLSAFNTQFEGATGSLLTALSTLSTATAQQQEQADQRRLNAWTETLGQVQQHGLTQLNEASQRFTSELSEHAADQQRALSSSAGQLESVAKALNSQWLATGERFDELTTSVASELSALRADEDSRAQAALARLGTLETSVAAHIGTLGNALEEPMTRLIKTASETAQQREQADQQRFDAWTETLGQVQQQGLTQLNEASQRFTGELSEHAADQQRALSSSAGQLESVAKALNSQWLATGERFDQLTTSVASELSALRADEDSRAQAALARLGTLETSVAAHIGTLGNALEEPMTRLIKTASETPRAAAEVIGQLRNEMANTVQREHDLLKERQGVMQDLNLLSQTMQQTATAQSAAIEHLVTSCTLVLKDVSATFSTQVTDELSKVTDATDQFSGSAIEISALGEAFGLAVQLFSESNSQLIERLGSMEASLSQSTQRSDEQMGYYVAQAREIIDQTMLSQQQLVEELHTLSQPESLSAVAS